MAPPEYRCQQVQDRYADLKPQGWRPPVPPCRRALFSHDGVCDCLVPRGSAAIRRESSDYIRAGGQLFPILADAFGTRLFSLAGARDDDRSGKPNICCGWSQTQSVRPKVELRLGQAEKIAGGQTDCLPPKTALQGKV